MQHHQIAIALRYFYLGPTYSERLTKWRIEHADLAVGPLGGLAGDEHCDVCNAPLFRDERNTKCCFGRFKNAQGCDLGAEWYGPFCSFPNVPRPTGEFGELWYGSDACSKYFHTNTRLLNCAYAYSSLQANGILSLLMSTLHFNTPRY